jgi:hypothetical protein
MSKLILICILNFFLIASANILKAQIDSSQFSNKTFKPGIQTVQLYVEPLILSDPVILLNGTAQLRLAFDDLNGGKENYYITVLQCNYDWSPSELNSVEYISGFTEEEIRDYKFSFNTNQTFTHYSILFPNADFQITKSGNYILKVYADDDPENVILTRRFIVTENRVQINSDIKQADDVRLDRTYQQVNFSILHHGMDISNAFSEINIMLMQNFRWDNAISHLQPQFVRPEQLDYTHSLSTSFPAGKEFRYFDTRTIRYKTDRVKEISEEKNNTVITLFPDQSRANAESFSRKDIDGKFIPGVQDYNDQDTQADYTWVKFSFPVDYPFTNGRLYLLGAFTDWQLKDANRMQYNSQTKSYEVSMYLKQGYYEYLYFFSPTEQDGADDLSALLEGNSFETENQYQILVYYRPFGSRYDQVIGYKTTDTFNR